MPPTPANALIIFASILEQHNIQNWKTLPESRNITPHITIYSYGKTMLTLLLEVFRNLSHKSSYLYRNEKNAYAGTDTVCCTMCKKVNTALFLETSVVTTVTRW